MGHLPVFPYQIPASYNQNRMAKSPRARGEGWYARGAETVAEALSLPKEAIASLDPYRIGTEPVDEAATTERAPAHHRLAPDEVDRELAQFEEDAGAGVPDELIARRSGLSVDTVARWRRRRGIKHPRGRPSAEQLIHRAAVELFGRPPADTWMRTRESPVMGRWEVPQYLLRRPLDYSAFAEATSKLMEAGLTPGRIAAGLGVRTEDVAVATTLWRARCER